MCPFQKGCIWTPSGIEAGGVGGQQQKSRGKDAPRLQAKPGEHARAQTYPPCPGYAQAKPAYFLLKVQAHQDHAALPCHPVARSLYIWFC